MNANTLFFFEKFDLNNNSDVKWLISWCKQKRRYSEHHTWDNSTTYRNSESESVIFSLEDFMDYLKLVNVALFEKIID